MTIQLTAFEAFEALDDQNVETPRDHSILSHGILH
jgi:hypothetical protein